MCRDWLPSARNIVVRNAYAGLCLLGLMLGMHGMLCVAQEKPKQAHIESDIWILPEQVVQEQWPATLELVNAPTNLEHVEPGQCVRFGVVATGDGRDVLLKQTKFGFEFSFSGTTQTFVAEPAQAVKQIKPHGGDFVTQALASIKVENPLLTLASLAASRAGWCVPLDAHDGTATLRGTGQTSDGKTVSLKQRRLEVRTYETARKTPPFKDINEVGAWVVQYYQAPDPAQLLPALRMVTAVEEVRKSSNTMAFFIAALKAHKPAAEELMRKLPGEERWVRLYAAAALNWAGYSTDALMSGFTEKDKSFLSSMQLKNAFDMTPAADIGGRQDMLWSIFFATGDMEPVRVIASELAWADDYRQFKKTFDAGTKPEWNASTFRAVAYSAAGWSLGRLSHQDPLVADYVDAIRSSPNTLLVVKNELAHLFDNPAFRPLGAK
ncbi:MAG TPA: hypothetical protein VI636_01665 [Candidatus Angelobacter sp.]